MAALERLVNELGYRLAIADTGSAEGVHHGARKLIEVSERLQPNGRLAAGIHEVGHALVALDELAPELTYAEEELVVESVAFCACQTLGLATDANSIPYLANWAEAADLVVLERAVALTTRLANRIEDALLATDGDTAPAAG